MSDRMETLIDNRRASADLVVTQLIRQQQIVGGFVTDEDGEYQFFNSVKADRFADVLAQHQKPLMVFARFLPEIEQLAQIAQKQKRRILLHTGQYKMGSSDFPKADVILAQISTLAGLDGIQRYVSTGLFYSKSFSRIEYEQARTRLLRSGQEQSVQFLHFKALSSIDEDLDFALSGKGDVIEGVVRHMKRRIAPR